MPPRVYVETSVISYLAARPSRDLITAAREQLTHEWWRGRHAEFVAHVANAVHRPRVERVCRAHGYEPPVLCTPDELLGGGTSRE